MKRQDRLTVSYDSGVAPQWHIDGIPFSNMLNMDVNA